jgi:NADPH-dependent F420 reductase
MAVGRSREMRCERIDTERERSTMEAHIQSTTIAVLGGTGKEGKGLALRWAAKGHEVIIGSRDATRAQATADEIRIRAGNNARVRGADNASAAQEASIIVLAVPYSAQLATAQEVAAQLTGKVLIDVTVPLAPPKVDRVQLPPGGSAVLALQEKLGAQVKVVSAFQNVSAGHLWDLEHVIECDVLVCGDDADAREAAVRRNEGLARGRARKFGGGRSADLRADRHQQALQDSWFGPAHHRHAGTLSTAHSCGHSVFSRCRASPKFVPAMHCPPISCARSRPKG